jgi:asparagine synthetase B (glutamine-hydrolysing)
LSVYQGWDKSGNYFIASELKALEGVCNKIETFLPDISFIAKTDKNYSNGTKEIGKVLTR